MLEAQHKPEVGSLEAVRVVETVLRQECGIAGAMMLDEAQLMAEAGMMEAQQWPEAGTPDEAQDFGRIVVEAREVVPLCSLIVLVLLFVP